MGSEAKKISEHPVLRRILAGGWATVMEAVEHDEWERPRGGVFNSVAWAKYKERVLAWEAENRELANDWDAAFTEEDERKLAAREARNLSFLEDAMVRRGIPLRCAGTVMNAQDTAPLMAVRGFLTSGQNFCLMLGGAGAGKSTAAAWAIYEPMRLEAIASAKEEWGGGPSYAGQFVRAAELARMSVYGKESHERLDTYCRTAMLVIDDLGTERPSDMWLAMLDELIDCRYGDKLKTILTSNLDAGAFRERYGERISDRIRHDGLIVGAGADSLRARRRES